MRTTLNGPVNGFRCRGISWPLHSSDMQQLHSLSSVDTLSTIDKNSILGFQLQQNHKDLHSYLTNTKANYNNNMILWGSSSINTQRFSSLPSTTITDKRSAKNKSYRGSLHDNKETVSKGQWSAEEDRLLIKLVQKFGIRKWSHIAQMLVGRVGKQCRERWHNHLRPNIKKDTWTEEEERVLVQSHAEMGNKWSQIMKRLPRRTENAIKNHWNATKRKQATNGRNKRILVDGVHSRKSSILQDYIRSLRVNRNQGKTQVKMQKPPFDVISSSSNQFQEETDVSYCPNPPNALQERSWKEKHSTAANLQFFTGNSLLFNLEKTQESCFDLFSVKEDEIPVEMANSSTVHLTEDQATGSYTMFRQNPQVLNSPCADQSFNVDFLEHTNQFFMQSGESKLLHENRSNNMFEMEQSSFNLTTPFIWGSLDVEQNRNSNMDMDMTISVGYCNVTNDENSALNTTAEPPYDDLGFLRVNQKGDMDLTEMIFCSSSNPTPLEYINSSMFDD